MSSVSGELYRGVVSSITAGWRTAHLPLSSINDDVGPVFPATISVPGSTTDDDPVGGTLLLYRVRGDALTRELNSLVVTKSIDDVRIDY